MDMKETFSQDMQAAKNGQVSQNIQEDPLTRAIENQTAKLPSVSFLTLALASMGVSAATAFFFNRKPLANFIGLWAPSILVMGVYNKLVKIESEIVRQGMH